MMIKPPFTLTTESVSRDTIDCLRSLLRRAERGEVIGVAYCAMMRRRTFTVNATGEADRNPTFTRGMIAALDDELGQRARGSESV